MDKEKTSPVLYTAVSSILLFAFYIAVSKLCFAIFLANMFGQDYMSGWVLDTVKLIISLFIFYSIAYTFSVNNKYALCDYDSRGEEENFLGSRLSHVLSGKFFWIQLLCIAVLSLVLPVSFTYGFISGVFLPHLNGLSLKLSTLTIILPVLFVLVLLSGTEACRKWFYLKRKKKAIDTSIAKTVKELCIAAAVFLGGSVCVPWFLPFIVTMINFANRYNLPAIVLYLVGAVLLLFLVYVAVVYLRAVAKRKRFIYDLKRLSEKSNMVLSGIDDAYSSLFLRKSGINFSVEKDNRRYDCKFVAGVFYGSPIIFSENGSGVCKHTFRFLRLEIFSILSRVDYTFDSENEKILIVLPIPKNIYVATADSKPRPADTGDVVGDYKIYNATGFLNGLERGSIIIYI